MAAAKSKGRAEKGKRAANVSMAVDFSLFCLKLIAGVLGRSSALVVDAFHTLSDMLTSVIVFLGFYITVRPPDVEHQYGHGDAEGIAAFIVSLLIFLSGIELLRYSVSKLLAPVPLKPANELLVVLLLSLIPKIGAMRYLSKIGKEINSPAVLADARHARSDIYASAVAFAGILGANLGYAKLDPAAGIVIALLILKLGIENARSSIEMITGMVKDVSLIEDIKKIAMRVEGVKGVHNVKLHYFGAYANVELHVEVDKDMRVVEADKIAHKVQARIVMEMGDVRSAIIHVCPYKHSEVAQNA